ncbi:MAG: response regulator [Gammaproteobacteria bacterium]|nr:response regulator [Gammaproteobacteria bacterium]
MTHDVYDVPGGTERILVVDDEEMVADVIGQIIGDLGYEVETFTDSRAALDRFAREPDQFNLVLTDNTMPGLKGHRLAGEIHRLAPRTPIILCSADGHRLDEATMSALGIRELLMKPVGAADLGQAVRRQLDAAAAERRRHQRFVPRDKAFVIFRSHSREAGKLVDISLSGLAFNYDEEEARPDTTDALSIVLGSEEYEVPDLPYRTVSDIDVDSSGGGRIRRRGIQFENLTRAQTERLGRLIEEFAVLA